MVLFIEDVWLLIKSYLIQPSTPAVLTFTAYKNRTNYCTKCFEPHTLPNGGAYVRKRPYLIWGDREHWCVCKKSRWYIQSYLYTPGVVGTAADYIKHFSIYNFEELLSVGLEKIDKLVSIHF